jgi:putative tryptophan/tyrosine transport system substrate-binding protein
MRATPTHWRRVAPLRTCVRLCALALIKEALPRVSRVAVLRDPAADGALRRWQEMQTAARTLGLTVERMDTREPRDFPTAFAAMTRRRPDALVTLLSPLTSAYRPIIVEFATRQRLPTMFGQRADVEAGGLMAYSPSVADMFRRAAVYVDRILKGAKPGDLPIERPTKFELSVNLKTARALGITVPQSVLVQADTLIDP